MEQGQPAFAGSLTSKSEYHDRIDRQYNDASAHYDRVKTLPYAFAEEATIRSVLPKLDGLRVLDLGCGTGYYTRAWRREGASDVLGVDAASGMIKLAREIEAARPLGVSYAVADGASIPRYGQFDVITPIWMFNYAKDVAEHHQMLARCAENLAPGGVVVALCSNPDVDFNAMAQYSRYGLNMERGDNFGDLTVCHIKLNLDPPVTFDGFFWPSGVVEDSMQRAGLVDIQRHPVAMPGHPPGAPGASYWAELAANPPFALFTARHAR